MNIKSLLLGSAAALVAVSGARAADAVVIPEPEAVEYVRVCDAAGAGYFYIPGGETCLKIGGYVQYEISTGEGATDGWNKGTEARLTFDSWTDSEYGAVKTHMRLTSGAAGSVELTNEALTLLGVDITDAAAVAAAQAAADGSFSYSNVLVLDRAHLSIGGLNMGLNGSFYDFSQTGAADAQVGNGYAANQISYTADFSGGSFGIQLVNDANYNYLPDVIAKLTFSAGDFGITAAAVYADVEESFGAKVTATYAGFGAVVQYSANDLVGSDYAGSNQWVIGANYGFDATDKLNLNLGVAYGFEDSTYGDANWTVGAEATYKLTDTFTVSTRARVMDNDAWDARLRFKASF